MRTLDLNGYPKGKLTLPHEVSLTTTVIENRGRYAGNSAKWRFVIRIH